MSKLKTRIEVKNLKFNKKKLYFRVIDGNKKKSYITDYVFEDKEWNNSRKCVMKKQNQYWKKDEDYTQRINEDLRNFNSKINEIKNSNPSLDLNGVIEVYKDPNKSSGIINIHSSEGFDEICKLYLKYLENKPVPTQKNFKTILKHIKKFSEETNYILSVFSINHNFMIEFAKYKLSTSKNNHIIQILKRIKTMINYGIRVNKYKLKDIEIYDINNLGFKKYNTQSISLSKAELQLLINHHFKNKSLEKASDIFVFMCLTGQRYNYYLNYCKSEYFFNDRFWKFTQKKGTVNVRVPLLPKAIEILKKYKYQIPFLSNQKMNKKIKELIKLIGLNRVINYNLMQGNEVQNRSSIISEDISCHDSRSTFITLAYSNIGEIFIDIVTGHSTAGMKKLYVNLDDNDLYNKYIENEYCFY